MITGCYMGVIREDGKTKNARKRERERERERQRERNRKNETQEGSRQSIGTG
jgi:hypothetical protein